MKSSGKINLQIISNKKNNKKNNNQVRDMKKLKKGEIENNFNLKQFF
jgi:hypothetical protein